MMFIMMTILEMMRFPTVGFAVHVRPGKRSPLRVETKRVACQACGRLHASKIETERTHWA